MYGIHSQTRQAQHSPPSIEQAADIALYDICMIQCTEVQVRIQWVITYSPTEYVYTMACTIMHILEANYLLNQVRHTNILLNAY